MPSLETRFRQWCIEFVKSVGRTGIYRDFGGVASRNRARVHKQCVVKQWITCATAKESRRQSVQRCPQGRNIGICGIGVANLLRFDPAHAVFANDQAGAPDDFSRRAATAEFKRTIDQIGADPTHILMSVTHS